MTISATEKSSMEKSIPIYSKQIFKEDNKIRLNRNESFWGCSPKVLQAFQKIQTKDICEYPAYGPLISKLSDINQIEEEYITITNGADEGLSIIFQTYLNKNDKVALLKPSFFMYEIFAQQTQAQIVYIQYEPGFLFPQECLLENIDDTIQLIVLGSPNNPTGESISNDNLEQILQKRILTVVDEVYFNYAGSSALKLVKQYNNLIIVRSFSKDYGLAGLRMGYIVSSSENINRLNQYILPYNVNSTGVLGTMAALEDSTFLEETIDSVKKCRTYFINQLQKLNFQVYPSDGNFILLNAAAKSDLIYQKLANNNIEIKKYDNDIVLKDHLRMTVPNLQTIDKVIDLITDYDTLIFDLDGVIVDVDMSYHQAILETYKIYAEKPLEYSRIQNLKKLGGYNNDWILTQSVLQEDGFVINLDQIKETFNNLYIGNEGDGLIQKEKLLIQKGNIETLAKKYTLAIFTGRPRKDTDLLLKIHGLEEYFATVVTMDDLNEEEQKPNPAGLYKIISQLGSKRVLYIGDLIDDILAAQKALIDSIGIVHLKADQDGSLKQRMKNHGALLILDNTADIVKIFGGHNENL